MKNGRAAGPTRLTVDLIKAAGKEGGGIDECKTMY